MCSAAGWSSTFGLWLYLFFTHIFIWIWFIHLGKKKQFKLFFRAVLPWDSSFFFMDKVTRFSWVCSKLSRWSNDYYYFFYLYQKPGIWLMWTKNIEYTIFPSRSFNTCNQHYFPLFIQSIINYYSSNALQHSGIGLLMMYV